MKYDQHYEVHGPGRDYDYSVFCEKHNNEACDFAGAWIFEAFDAAEIGEMVKVEMKVAKGDIPTDCECCECGRSPNNDVEPTR